MSLGHGASIVRDGLVFYYDQGNIQKSWKGAPTTNLAKNASNVVDWTVYSLTQSVTRSTIVANEVYRITSTSGTGSSFRIKFDNATLVNGATYTVSYKYKIISGGPQFNANDWCDTSITRTTTSLANNVFYETAVGTRATYDSTYRFLDFEMSNNTVVEIYDLQLEQRSFATPYTSTQVRSTTQALLDLTKRNTVTAHSLTYASDNTFSFNGSSDYISAPVSLGSSDPLVTVNMWIRRTNTVNNAGYWGLGGGSAGNGINGYTSVANKIGWDLWGQTTFHTGQDYPLDQWVNVCWVKTAASFTTSTLKVYINGVEFPLTTTVRNNASAVNLITGLQLGRLSATDNLYYAPGSIGLAAVYNVALSEAEVRQNFNAHRGRYGV